MKFCDVLPRIAIQFIVRELEVYMLPSRPEKTL